VTVERRLRSPTGAKAHEMVASLKI